MTQQRPLHKAHGRARRLVVQLGSLAAMAVAVSLIIIFWGELKRHQEAFSDVRADNVQWTVGQAMVEYQALDIATHFALSHPATAESLADVRLRFDILFNRLDILSTGPLYVHLLDDLSYRLPFERSFQALKDMIPIIESDDAALAAALPSLARQIEAIGADVREFNLTGVRVFARQSAVLRAGLDKTMTRVSMLTLGMLGLLLVLTAILLRQSRLAEDRLVTQERTSARIEAILRTANDAIFVLGMNGRIIEFNGAAERMFGLQPRTGRDRRLRSVLRPPTPDWHPVQLIGKGNVELQARGLQGQVFPVEVTVDRVEIDDNPVLVAFIRDISVRKTAEIELIEARDRALAGERAKANFVAVMSHELRTPLNGILGMLTLLRDTPLNAQQRDYVARMETSGQILLSSANDVLDISHSEAGGVRLGLVPTALESLLRAVTDSQTGAATARGTRLRFQALTPLPEAVLVDPERLRQILLNLIGNAVKFTENGEIALEAEMHPDPDNARRGLLELRVSDTGVGIADADLARVFDDFETGDASMAREQSGSGLGLAIVRRLVAAMKGSVEVDSLLGEGSIFTLKLPVSYAATGPAPVVQPGAAAMGGHGLNVLVVEDNDVNREVLGGLLDRRGAKVTEAVSAAAGIERAAQLRFDLILMDLSMPGIDGIEAARRIRASGGPSAAAPIYAVTAHTGLSLADLDARAGINGILTKPLLPAEVDALLAGTAAAPQVLDTARLDQLCEDLGPARLLGLLDRFAAEAATETATLAETPNAAPEDTGRRAHKLAGAAHNFGTQQLARQLDMVQKAAEVADMATIALVMARLPSECDAALSALTDWRATVLADQTA